MDICTWKYQVVFSSAENPFIVIANHAWYQTNNMAKIGYYPLKSNHIRLLELINAADPADDLDGALYTTDIAQAPTYRDLSYTWVVDGAINDQHTLTIGKQAMLITNNLFDALVQIRSTHHSSLLWIDQICIDQSNLAERAARVALMERIYLQASEVVIWLGVADTDTAMAFAYPNQLIAEAQRAGINDVRETSFVQYGFWCSQMSSPARQALTSLYDGNGFRGSGSFKRLHWLRQ